MAEKMSREEAVQFLTMQRDLFMDTLSAVKCKPDADKLMAILEVAGDKIGYAPAFRCLVKGLAPEDSIKWGK